MVKRDKVARRLLFSAAAFLVAAGVVVPTGAASAANQPTTDAITQPFHYPVLPGTPQWRQLPTHDAMVAALQIPTQTLARMSTEALTTTVLDYPLLPDALAFNSVQKGFETVASRFNGLSELLRRQDAGTVLFGRYRSLDPSVSPDAKPLAAGNHAMQVWKVETLLAQPQVLGTLNAAQLETLLETGKQKSAIKKANAKVYGAAGLEPTATLAGRALAVREGWDWKRSQLLRDGIQLTPGAVQSTLKAVAAHLSSPTGASQAKVLLARDYNSTVTTPRGSRVNVITMTYELTAAQRSAADNWVRTHYPSASLERSASRKYNCHSYAWYSTSTSNDRWMNNPGDDVYWQDGSYIWWHPPLIWYSGMKLSYAAGDHSGIWVGTSSDVRSKWGQYGQVKHRATYAPYNSSTLNSYYRS